MNTYKTLVFLPDSGDLFDTTNVPQQEVQQSLAAEKALGRYPWVIYFQKEDA